MADGSGTTTDGPAPVKVDRKGSLLDATKNSIREFVAQFKVKPLEAWALFTTAVVW